MRDFFGAVNVVLSNPRTEDQPLERLRAIRRHVDDVFDFREAARLALGRQWAAHTAVEQNEFVALFADLLERSFVWRVAGKAALGGASRCSTSARRWRVTPPSWRPRSPPATAATFGWTSAWCGGPTGGSCETS